MAEFVKGLYPNSDVVSSVPSASYSVKQFVISVALCSIENRHNRRNKTEYFNGHKYIVVAIDYFLRWIEAKFSSTLKAKQMANFIDKNLICRYGVPHHIVIDNGIQF